MRTPSDPLVAELVAAVGATAVVAQRDSLVAYESDAYTIARGAPRAVVLPSTREGLVAAVRIANRHGVPIVPRGAGTGLSGGAMADGGLVIGTSRLTRILEVDVPNRRALVEAGVVNQRLSETTRPFGLVYAPDPSSQVACTIGGNVAENAGGPHTLKHGVTANHVLGLELVTADGEVMWLGGEEEPEGLDLVGVVVGSEGTFGLVTRVLVRLVPPPEAVDTLLAVFPTVEQASGAVGEVIARGITPAALELMDQLVIRAVEEAYRFGFPLDAGAVLIAEIDGPAPGLARQAEAIVDTCRRHGATDVRWARDEAERALLWKSRKRAVGALGRYAPSHATQDGVIPRSQLPAVLARIARIADRYDLRIANVFHAGDGNLHPVVLFDDRDPDQVRRVVAAGAEVLEACVAAGGTITGEHGIGVEKLDALSLLFGPADLAAMARVKAAFDPANRCNPGKAVPTGASCGEARPPRPAGP